MAFPGKLVNRIKFCQTNKKTSRRRKTHRTPLVFVHFSYFNILFFFIFLSVFRFDSTRQAMCGVERICISRPCIYAYYTGTRNVHTMHIWCTRPPCRQTHTHDRSEWPGKCTASASAFMTNGWPAHTKYMRNENKNVRKRKTKKKSWTTAYFFPLRQCKTLVAK